MMRKKAAALKWFIVFFRLLFFTAASNFGYSSLL